MQQEDGNPSIAQRLSALADGELDSEAVRVACARWRDDGEARSVWHTYHLIGDVLRSDALASDAAHDERFLRRLRERLAVEPPVLAPLPLATSSPASASASARWKWLAPVAVAAGFVAIASVLVVTRGTLPPTGADGGAVLASTTAPGRTVLATAAPGRAGGPIAGEGLVAPQTFVADRQFVRDARLDRYLAAHMEFGGSSALGAPSGFLRAATSRMPDR